MAGVFALAWMTCGVRGVDAPTGATAAPATQPAAVSAAFPSFGAAFELPGGWTEVPLEKSGRIGQWISPDSTSEKLKGLIMIETGRPGGASPEVMAKSLARNFGGVVMDEPTTLGGEPALVVRADNHDDELAPTEGIICVKGHNVFLVMAGTVKGKSVKAEIEAIRKSWKWTAVEKPAGHLAARAEPFAAFAGRATLNVPRMMHTIPSDDPDTQLDLALYNLARNTTDFRATMTLITLGPGESFDDAKARFLEELGKKHKFVKAGPTWHRCDGGTPRVLTAMVEAERPQPADTDTLYHQWAMVNLGDDTSRAVLVHFTHEAETDEERKLFQQAAEQIVTSVSAGKGK
jgi:hypothetical protein